MGDKKGSKLGKIASFLIGVLVLVFLMGGLKNHIEIMGVFLKVLKTTGVLKYFLDYVFVFVVLIIVMKEIKYILCKKSVYKDEKVLANLDMLVLRLRGNKKATDMYTVDDVVMNYVIKLYKEGLIQSTGAKKLTLKITEKGEQALKDSKGDYKDIEVKLLEKLKTKTKFENVIDVGMKKLVWVDVEKSVRVLEDKGYCLSKSKLKVLKITTLVSRGVVVLGGIYASVITYIHLLYGLRVTYGEYYLYRSEFEKFKTLRLDVRDGMYNTVDDYYFKILVYFMIALSLVILIATIVFFIVVSVNYVTSRGKEVVDSTLVELDGRIVHNKINIDKDYEEVYCGGGIEELLKYEEFQIFRFMRNKEVY